MTKPLIFIGSSSEARAKAQAFADELNQYAIAMPWWIATEFSANFATLESLLAAVDRYDFVVFIMTPDDTLESRGQKHKSARDNVLFEAGLFLGQLGRDRVRIFVEDTKDKKKSVKIPSDLLGINLPRFQNDNHDSLIASINRAVGDLRSKIQGEGPRKHRLKLIEGWSVSLAHKQFSITLSPLAIDSARPKLKEKRLLLVARKQDSNKDYKVDTNIVLSELRDLPLAGQPLQIQTRNGGLKGIAKGDSIEGYLFLMPQDFRITKGLTIGSLESEGELLEVKGAKAKS